MKKSNLLLCSTVCLISYTIELAHVQVLDRLYTLLWWRYNTL